MAAIRPLVVASIAGYLAWIMIQFDPLSVVVHVGSYLMELAPLLMLCIMLQRWPALLGALAVAQAIFAFSMY